MRALSLILVLALLSGCNLSSSQRYQIADSSYRATVSAVTVLVLAGEVSEEDLGKFDVVRSEARTLLDSWSESLARGEDFPSEIEFQTLIDTMLRVYLKLENANAGGSSSTQSNPSGRERAYRSRRKGGQSEADARGTWRDPGRSRKRRLEFHRST